MPRTSNARQKAVQTAIRLFQRQGYRGTGLAQLLRESGAPKGSFYHHFPGGKEQLAVEAILETTRGVEALLAAAGRDETDPVQIVRRLARGIARWLEDSKFSRGCPVVALTVEAVPASNPLQLACRHAYKSWRQLLADALEVGVGGRPRAERIAALTVAALEGALLLAKAEGSAAPLEAVGEELAEHVRGVVDQVRSRTRG